MKIIKLSNEEVNEIVEDQEPVEEGRWRWGTTGSYVIDRDGKHYLFTARFHVEEGLQEEGPYNAYEVEPIQVTQTVWRRVKQHD